MTATATQGTTITVKVNGTEINNGTAATWEDGENTVTIVASGTGMTSTTYTVTVTKE